MCQRIQRFREPDVENRYYFDFGPCKSANGWAQVDTWQDAPWFGLWANPFQLRIVQYCEGDVTVQTADSPDDFVDMMLTHYLWFQDNSGDPKRKFFAIDPMCQDRIAEAFTGLQLGAFLH